MFICTHALRKRSDRRSETTFTKARFGGKPCQPHLASTGAPNNDVEKRDKNETKWSPKGTLTLANIGPKALSTIGPAHFFAPSKPKMTPRGVREGPRRSRLAPKRPKRCPESPNRPLQGPTMTPKSSRCPNGFFGFPSLFVRFSLRPGTQFQALGGQLVTTFLSLSFSFLALPQHRAFHETL